MNLRTTQEALLNILLTVFSSLFSLVIVSFLWLSSFRNTPVKVVPFCCISHNGWWSWKKTYSGGKRARADESSMSGMWIYLSRIFTVISENIGKQSCYLHRAMLYAPPCKNKFWINHRVRSSISCVDIGTFSTMICFIPVWVWTGTRWILSYNRAWNLKTPVLRLLHYLSSVFWVERGTKVRSVTRRRFYRALITTIFGGETLLWPS